MSSLTSGSPHGHLLKMSVPILIGLAVYSSQPLVDLFFLGALGEAAVAGVGAAASLSFLVTALTQIFASGTTSLVSFAVGSGDVISKKDVYQQSFLLALVFGILIAVVSYTFADEFLGAVSADVEVVDRGREFLYAFIPYMALLFPSATMTAALRGEGIVNIPILIQLTSVLLNIIIAPILISGHITGYPLGVAGAGLATSISSVVCLVLLLCYAQKAAGFGTFSYSSIWGRRKYYKNILTIGVPVSGEFILLFIYMASVYHLTKELGAETQAGFAIGTRLMQMLTMPAIALMYSIPAMVGQSKGAAQYKRVSEIFVSGLILVSFTMLAMSAITFSMGEAFMRQFTLDSNVIFEGAAYLDLMALSYLPMGMVFVCSGVFQGLGVTWPVFCSAFLRTAFFLLPFAFFVKVTPELIWELSVATTFLQAIISFIFLRRLLATYPKQSSNPIASQPF